MKKTSVLKSLLVVSCAVSCLFAVSCKKEMAGTQNPNALSVSDPASTSAATMKSNDISTAISPFGVLGTYSVRGSRTVYRGQANRKGDNIILSLDYIGEKKVQPSPDEKALICGYGETNFVNQGWKYIIRYDRKKNVITLAPNDTMAAAIAPGSFETLYADYDARYNQFTFQTRFTNLEGNENEVVDILVKK